MTTALDIANEIIEEHEQIKARVHEFFDPLVKKYVKPSKIHVHYRKKLWNIFEYSSHEVEDFLSPIKVNVHIQGRKVFVKFDYINECEYGSHHVNISKEFDKAVFSGSGYNIRNYPCIKELIQELLFWAVKKEDIND